MAGDRKISLFVALVGAGLLSMGAYFTIVRNRQALPYLDPGESNGPVPALIADPSAVFSGPALQVSYRVLGFRNLIAEAAGKYGVPAALISAVIHQESGGNPNAYNPNDPSYGLMQLCCARCAPCESGNYCHACCGCHDYTGPLQNLYQPALNIELGTRYLRHQILEYSSNIACVVSAYNAGSCKLWANPLYVASVTRLYHAYDRVWS